MKSNLDRARKRKRDEFRTSLIDIEKEVDNYRDQFRGKSVLCNCNDGWDSNFLKYFLFNFSKLGLRELVGIVYRADEDLSETIQVHVDEAGGSINIGEYV